MNLLLKDSARLEVSLVRFTTGYRGQLSQMGKTEILLASLAVWLALLVTCAVPLPTTPESQTQPPHRVGEGLSLMGLYNRSQCQPRSVLLNLLDEFPELSDYVFVPPCVSAKRCSGCCLDEGLRCVPTHTHNITMEVYRIKAHISSQLTEIVIAQHTRCQCRPKNNDMLKVNRLSGKAEKKIKKGRRKGKNERDANEKNRSVCAPCGKRKTLNTKTCKCVCKWSEEKCHQKGQTFNKGKCRCEKTNS